MELTAVAARPSIELEARTEHILASPAAVGTLELIVARPVIGARQVLDAGELDLVHGLVGDCWRERGTSRGPEANPDKQLTLMNSRVISTVAGDDRAGWAEAGDQLYVDFDLSYTNLPAGTRLRIGGAVIELTGSPHRGCAKFRARFGEDALLFVNSQARADLSFRGRNAKVVQPGSISCGDEIVKATPS